MGGEILDRERPPHEACKSVRKTSLEPMDGDCIPSYNETIALKGQVIKVVNKRIEELDTIRGFALLGIILVNILALLHIDIPAPHTLDASYQRFLYLFVEGRFYSIFSFLFGVGFYIFLTRAKDKEQNGSVLFLRRMLVLFAFGVIHMMFQPGEALAIYAVCGLLVLPFYKVNKHVNLLIALSLLGIFAMMGSKLLLTLPLILLGLVCGQYRLFENLSKKRRIYFFTSVLLVLSTVAVYMQYKLVPAEPFFNMIMVDEKGHMDAASSFLKVGVMIGPILSACYVGLLLVLLQSKVVKMLLTPLNYYGRMALTNYLGQTALILLIGKVFHVTANLSYMGTFYICIAICAVQMVFSMVWLRYFTMGPFEWVWRMITYWKFFSIRRVVRL